ncbi:MAG: S1C family serine protease, partial [Armatimonadota bacterium]|nr:S1C family serine protease [Armatimonadota bacterium]
MMRRFVDIVVVSLALGIGAGIGSGLMNRTEPAAWAQGGADTEGRTAEETAVVRVVREATPAVVSIREGDSNGSGVIFRANGLILTNAHVLEGNEKIEVRLSDGRSFDGQVIGRDTAADIAVIKIPARGLPWLTIGDSDHVDPGQTAIVIGDPL